MATLVTMGLRKIEFGPMASDGGMGTLLSVLGYTYQDTFTFNTEDGDDVEHYAEEVDDPIVSFQLPGKINFEFDVMDPDLNTLQRVFGGKITGSGDTARWEAPSTTTLNEWSCKITPEQGLVWEFPRVSVVATLSGTFSKKELFLVHIKGTILVPKKDGYPKMTSYKLLAPAADLSTVITNTTLGELPDNDDETILEAAKGLNSSLDMTQVEVQSITTTGATIVAKAGSDIYTGSVNVTFTLA